MLQKSNYMICPPRDLGTTFMTQMDCVPNTVFMWQNYHVPKTLAYSASKLVGCLLFLQIDKLTLHQLGYDCSTIPYTLFQWHAVLLALFASVVGPFGGFFASGFKRAFEIKDFGQSIPGHGGMADRMDCQ